MNTSKLSKTLIFVSILACWNVEAATVTWTLDNVELSGGSVFASGSFDYDASSDIYSNINITSTGTYNSFLNGDAVYLDASGSYLGGLTIFNFNFDAALTDAGGTISTSVEEVLFYTLPSPPVLLTGSGFVTAPAVPIPAAVWLFGSGLIGLISIARRKK